MRWGVKGGMGMFGRKAFTLIELLVVIAIIAILAGITFPVFATARRSAYRSSDISSLNSIRSALQLYRADQGGYPPVLLGYVTPYQTGSNLADIIPADRVVGALYPKRIDSLATLRPSYVRATGAVLEREWTTATWPQGLAPQRFGPGQGPNAGLVSRCVPGIVDPVINQYYRISGYDVARVATPGGSRDELRYTLGWSTFTAPAQCTTDSRLPGASPDVQGSGSDNPRQLIYSEPPESTVVTWNSFFRDTNGGVPTRTKNDIVLFLSGQAKPYDSVEVASRAWQVQP